jgi:hypothetical protein
VPELLARHGPKIGCSSATRQRQRRLAGPGRHPRVREHARLRIPSKLDILARADRFHNGLLGVHSTHRQPRRVVDFLVGQPRAGIGLRHPDSRPRKLIHGKFAVRLSRIPRPDIAVSLFRNPILRAAGNFVRDGVQQIGRGGVRPEEAGLLSRLPSIVQRHAASVDQPATLLMVDRIGADRLEIAALVLDAAPRDQEIDEAFRLWA